MGVRQQLSYEISNILSVCNLQNVHHKLFSFKVLLVTFFCCKGIFYLEIMSQQFRCDIGFGQLVPAQPLQWESISYTDAVCVGEECSQYVPGLMQ